jgi:hypothetical protein
MQVGERFHNHAIGLLEFLDAFLSFSMAPASQAKPRHDTFLPRLLESDLFISLCAAMPPSVGPPRRRSIASQISNVANAATMVPIAVSTVWRCYP